MTPFRIRERIKDLLGLSSNTEEPPPRPAKPQVTLVLLDDKGVEHTATGDAGISPLFLSGEMSRGIASGCNDSNCSTCRIEVLEGAENLSPQDPHERKVLKENGHSEELRLACYSSVLSGTVKVRAFEYF